MDSVRSLRRQYIAALMTTGVVVCACFFYLANAIQQQENTSRAIELAGTQLGLVHRIAFFAQSTQLEETEEHYTTALQQLRASLNAFEKNQDALVNGDPTRDIPKIQTGWIITIYFDASYGLQQDIDLLVARGRKIANTQYSMRKEAAPDVVYVSTLGPYTIAPLIAEVQSELNRYHQDEIRRIHLFELLAAGLTILLLLGEALFVFKPFEKRLKKMLEDLNTTETALRHKAIAAEAAIRSKTNFLQNLSHELRTPLNAINGFSDALIQGIYGPLSSRQAEPLKNINHSGEYLVTLVGELLDLSAAEAGSMALEEEEVCLKRIGEETISRLSTLADKHNVSLSVGGPDMVVLADLKRIRQVMINLVNNAIKFSYEGGVVRISTYNLPDGRAGVVVKGDGIGMSPDEVRMARQRFGRTGEAYVKNQEGTGLGLSICIEIMSAHGGELNIKSAKGKGTTVEVLLPQERSVNAPQIPGHTPSLAQVRAAE